MGEQNGNATDTSGQPLQLASQSLASVLAGGNINDIEKAIEREIKVTDMIRKFCIRLTSIVDWVDESGVPYLLWQGAAKIAGKVGMKYEFDKDGNGNPAFNEKIFSDEHGECLEISISGMCEREGISLPEVGTSTSRDSLWGKRDGQFVPLSEVDRTDVKKKAVTNFLNRGLKSRMGLSFTWEEIAQATNGVITREKVVGLRGSIHYEKGKRGGKGQQSTSVNGANKRDRLAQLINEMANGDAQRAKSLLIQHSSFQGSNGVVAGKGSVSDLSDARVSKTLEKVEVAYKEWDVSQPTQTEMPMENGGAQ